MSQLRLLVDPPAAGDWNMAVDEMLLEAAAERGQATLRLYQWSSPTLSLGYFQAAADRQLHEPSLTAPLVRRASGGGAILHDRELTYSIALPTSHPLASDPESLYRAIHGLLANMLRESFEIEARLNELTLVSLGGDPFLCFQRRSVGDLLVGENKVCGSAQRRWKNALLQHGSLLAARSVAAPELPGLTESAGRSITPDDLAAAWLPRLREFAELSAAGRLTPAEVLRAQAIQHNKFADDLWTNRR